jgi:hypothetical protein
MDISHSPIPTGTVLGAEFALDDQEIQCGGWMFSRAGRSRDMSFVFQGFLSRRLPENQVAWHRVEAFVNHAPDS